MAVILRSFSGVHAASNVLQLGKMIPSPTPIMMRKTISNVEPPEMDIHKENVLSFMYNGSRVIFLPFVTANGVNKLKTAAIRTPSNSVIFPPILTEIKPPGLEKTTFFKKLWKFPFTVCFFKNMRRIYYLFSF